MLSSQISLFTSKLGLSALVWFFKEENSPTLRFMSNLFSSDESASPHGLLIRRVSPPGRALGRDGAKGPSPPRAAVDVTDIISHSASRARGGGKGSFRWGGTRPEGHVCHHRKRGVTEAQTVPLRSRPPGGV